MYRHSPGAMWTAQACKAADEEAVSRVNSVRGTLLRSPGLSAGAPPGPFLGGPKVQTGRAAPQGGAGARGGRRAAPEEIHPVVAFLAEIDMLQYAEALLDNGFDDMETLMEMEDLDMSDLGMPRGHVIKLRRRLRDLGGDEPRARQAAPAPSWAPAEPSASRYGPTSALVVGSRPEAQQVSAVQLSWEHVKHLGADLVGGLLYKNLFEIAPEAMQLFPREVRARYQSWTLEEANGGGDLTNSPALSRLCRKVIDAVGSSVAGMGDTEALVPELRMLGMRHVNYRGVTEAHFRVFQKALMFTLRQCLGNRFFTPEVEFAWSMVYGFISAIMREGLREATEIAAKSQRRAIGSAPSTEYAESSPAHSHCSSLAA